MLGVGYYFNLSSFEHFEVFEDVEYVWDTLKKLKSYIDREIRKGGRIKGEVMDGAFVSPDVIIEEGAFVEYGAMVKGPAIIGKGTVVRHGAYIREHCLIGENCVVGHASELKNVIMLNYSQAPHFAYVGDSILGNHVNLGAGTKLSNMKNNKGHVEVIVEGKRYDSGFIKLGAIIGDECQIGCNTVTNPGTIIGPRTLVYGNSLLRGFYPADTIVKLRQEQAICSVTKRETDL
jgi:NDP-sugar pyrophosphorylase family protein